jgi:hypothetical protein
MGERGYLMSRERQAIMAHGSPLTLKRIFSKNITNFGILHMMNIIQNIFQLI